MRRAVCLLLAACTLHAEGLRQPQPRTAPLFENQPSTAAAREIAAWWKDFGDPLLARTVETALGANLDLKLAAERILEARELLRAQKALFLPDVRFTGAAGGIRGGFNQGIIRVGPQDGSSRPSGNVISPFETPVISFGLDATWEMDVFGRLRAQERANFASLTALERVRHDALTIVAADTARAYADYRGYRAQADIARRNVETQRESLRLTEVRTRAGLATALDVERQRGQLANTQAIVPSLEDAAARSLQRLSVLTNRSAAELKQELGEADLVLPSGVPASIPAEVLRRRPDLRQLESNIMAEAAQVEVASAELKPRFNLSATMGRLATSWTGLSLGGGNYFSVLPAVSLPIFNTGRLRAGVRAAAARYDQAVTAYEQSALLAIEEAENAYSAVSKEAERAAALRLAVQAAETSVALALDQYKAGLADFLTVLDSQRSQLAAELELARARTSQFNRSVDLYKALGGGWQP